MSESHPALEHLGIKAKLLSDSLARYHVRRRNFTSVSYRVFPTKRPHRYSLARITVPLETLEPHHEIILADENSLEVERTLEARSKLVSDALKIDEMKDEFNIGRVVSIW